MQFEHPFPKPILNDRFLILKPLSAGGTAKVKLALDLQSNCKVALKILNNLKKESQNLMMTEVEAFNAV
jgi:serine/threonine protein kinase